MPLVDVDGRVWAVLAMQELPFYALTQENLALFALMAGALADTLEFGATVKSYDAKSTQRFEQRVRRCLVDARRHGVPASLVVFSVSNAARASELLPRVLEERRGIDEACLALAPDGGLRLFVLLPLTDGKGAESYLKRLDKAVQTKLRVSLNERGVKLMQAVDLQDSGQQHRPHPAQAAGQAQADLEGPRMRVAPRRLRRAGRGGGPAARLVVDPGAGATEAPIAAVGLYLLGAARGAAAAAVAPWRRPGPRGRAWPTPCWCWGSRCSSRCSACPGWPPCWPCARAAPVERKRRRPARDRPARAAGQPAATPTSSRRFGPGSLEGILRHSPDPETRLRVVLACRSCPSGPAVHLLRLALRDPVDDVRLLAYAVLERKEREIQSRDPERCWRNGRAASGQQRPAAARRATHAQLAELYWELVYQGLVEGELLAFSLEQVLWHAAEVRGPSSGNPRMALLAGRALLMLRPVRRGPGHAGGGAPPRPAHRGGGALPGRGRVPRAPAATRCAGRWRSSPRSARLRPGLAASWSSGREAVAPPSRTSRSLGQQRRACPAAAGQGADIGLLLEGTYPFVSGGVSSWVHEIITGLPELTFGVVFIGSAPEDYKPIRYKLPPNLVHVETHYLAEQPAPQRTGPAAASKAHELRAAGQAARRVPRAGRATSREPLRAAVGKIETDEGIGWRDFLSSDETWHQICASYHTFCTSPSFVDYFWTVRTMHGPLFKMAEIAARVPPVQGAALGVDRLRRLPGLAAAAAPPLPLRPHRARHLHQGTQDRSGPRRLDQGRRARSCRSGLEEDRTYVRRLWVRFFESIGRLAYAAADPIIVAVRGQPAAPDRRRRARQAAPG